MHNNKLITILKHFNKTDFNQFSKYIQSPYFNKSKQLLEFYQIVEKGIHSPKEKALEKTNVWSKLFPEQKYNDVRFRKLSSDLLKLIEGFLSQQVFDSNKLQQSANLIESVGIKGIEKLYSSAKRIADNESKKYPYEDSEFYLQQYQIQKNYYEIIQHKFKHSERQNLEEIDQNLDAFYFSEKLRYFCAVLSQKQRGSHTYNLSYEAKILELVSNKSENITPALSIYKQIYLTYKESEDVNHYFKLKTLLKKHGLKFKSVEAKSLYDAAINYCVKKSNQGNARFLEELFDVYVDLLNKQLIYIDGELDPFHFKNIVTAALRLNKFDWTENFIMSNQEKLPESSRDNAVTFNLARLYYYQKKYEKVIFLLQEVEYEDLVYNLSSKSLLIATYYENEEIEPLHSILESFRTYLTRRKDIPEGWRRPYLNLIKFTKKLIRIIPGDSKAIEKIKSELEITDDFPNSQWLRQQIFKLEK